LPGLDITDHQMRLYMSFRQTHDTAVAAAKAGFSPATGSRMIRACRPRKRSLADAAGPIRLSTYGTPRSCRS
jgi:hypothetical protein